uniref:Uncharacterized protein n=1 Tax=Siphoviridae sp. ctm7X10 TaxID=2827929 RepID=A0A8S5S4Z7_9CAUD|nr:MAG TPA: hypothetical protein [Siphoviridae sp. ctm7X10]
MIWKVIILAALMKDVKSFICKYVNGAMEYRKIESP